MDRRRSRFALLAAFMFGLLAGCAANHNRMPRGTNITAAQPTIELLGFPDCPNTLALRDNLTAALASMGKGWTFADINQEALPVGDPRRGWPTPTILVRGRDLFGMPAPTSSKTSCRMYDQDVPDARTIAGRLRSLEGE